MTDLVPFVKLHGDRGKASVLRRFALTQLGITQDLMKFRDLKQYKRRITLAGGIVITCMVQFGLSRVDIYVPPMLPNVELLKHQYSSYYLVVFWYDYSYGSAEDPLTQTYFLSSYSDKAASESSQTKVSIYTKPKLYTGDLDIIDTFEPFDLWADAEYVYDNSAFGICSSYTHRILPVPDGKDDGYCIAFFMYRSLYSYTLYNYDPSYSGVLGMNVAFAQSRLCFGSVTDDPKTGAGKALAFSFFIDSDGYIYTALMGLNSTDRLVLNLVKRSNVGAVLVSSSHTTTQTYDTAFYIRPWTLAYDGTTVYTDLPLKTGDSFSGDISVECSNNTLAETGQFQRTLYDFDPISQKIVSQQTPLYYSQYKTLEYSLGDFDYYNYTQLAKVYNNSSMTYQYRFNDSSGNEHTGTQSISGARATVYCTGEGEPETWVPTGEISFSFNYGGSGVSWSLSGVPLALNRCAFSYFNWLTKQWVIYDKIVTCDSYWVPGSGTDIHQYLRRRYLLISSSGETLADYMEDYFLYNTFSSDEEGVLGYIEEWTPGPGTNTSIPKDFESIALNGLRIVESVGTYAPDSAPQNAASFYQKSKFDNDSAESPEFNAASMGGYNMGSLSLPHKEWRFVTTTPVLNIIIDPATYEG